MAKSRTQIAREHVARLRRKAQAYDLLIAELSVLPIFLDGDDRAIAHINRFIKRAEDHVEKAVQE